MSLYFVAKFFKLDNLIIVMCLLIVCLLIKYKQTHHKHAHMYIKHYIKLGTVWLAWNTV